MSVSSNGPEHQWIAILDVCEILKEHFPEYMSQHCLCGEPIPTYMAWIDHVKKLMETTAAEGDPHGTQH